MRELNNNGNTNNSWISKCKIKTFTPLLLIFVLTLVSFTFFMKTDSYAQAARFQPSLIPLASTQANKSWGHKTDQYFDDLLNFQTDIHNFIYHYFDKEKWFKKGNFFDDNLFLNNRPVIKEKESQYLITVEIPGFSKEQISIELIGNSLMIKGDNKDSENKKEFKYIITLPTDIDNKNIKSKLANGVLIITIPRIKGKAKTITID